MAVVLFLGTSFFSSLFGLLQSKGFSQTLYIQPFQGKKPGFQLERVCKVNLHLLMQHIHSLQICSCNNYYLAYKHCLAQLVNYLFPS